MKKRTITVLLLIAFSCSPKPDPILGKWRVESKYYRATYNIVEVNDSLQGKVIYYNDDTTIIREEDDGEYFAFKNLKKDDGMYMDAISGATKTKDIKPNITLKLRHPDTLDVTTYVRNNALKETWIRIKKR